MLRTNTLLEYKKLYFLIFIFKILFPTLIYIRLKPVVQLSMKFTLRTFSLPLNQNNMCMCLRSCVRVCVWCVQVRQEIVNVTVCVKKLFSSFEVVALSVILLLERIRVQ